MSSFCCSYSQVGSSVQFSHSVMSNSLWLNGLQHTRPPCPSPTPGVYSNSCSLSWWCHPTIWSSVIPFSSCLQSFPASVIPGGQSQILPLWGEQTTLLAVRQRGNVLWGRVLCVIIITKATNSKSKKQFPSWSQNWLLCNSPRTQHKLIIIEWVQDGRQVNFD